MNEWGSIGYETLEALGMSATSSKFKMTRQIGPCWAGLCHGT